MRLLKMTDLYTRPPQLHHRTSSIGHIGEPSSETWHLLLYWKLLCTRCGQKM